jgi:NAD-dependent dihydropyrimidine dehydrogenase PreA subunit
MRGSGERRARPSLSWQRGNIMTYVITQPCIGVKDASCVDVCPVDCIRAEAEDEQFFINPEECIDCGACEPVCPVNAIFEEGSVPKRWKPFIQLNADYFLSRRQSKKKRK